MAAIASPPLASFPPDPPLQRVASTADPRSGAPGRLVAVVGAGDALAAVAACLAEAIALGARGRGWDGPVVLADLTLDATLQTVHPVGPGGRGVGDLIDSAGDLDPSAVGSAPGGRRYRYVPGLSRHRDWIRLRSDAAERALGALRASAAVVVVAVDPDLEGEADTGSFDIEDRNLLARLGASTADVVVSASSATRIGLGAQAGVLRALADLGVATDRTWAVLATTAGRRPAGRRAAAQLLAGVGAASADRIAWVRAPSDGSSGHRWGRWGRRQRSELPPLPRRSVRSLADLAVAVLERPGEPAPTNRRASDVAQLLLPGELGHWVGDDDPGWITPRVPQQP